MKAIVTFLFCLSLSTTIFAQELKKFNKDKFNDLRYKHNFQELVPSMIESDTLAFALAPGNDIDVYVPKGEMASMPSMMIRKDINYTIQIKKYTNNYPYSSGDESQKEQQELDNDKANP